MRLAHTITAPNTQSNIYFMFSLMLIAFNHFTYQYSPFMYNSQLAFLIVFISGDSIFVMSLYDLPVQIIRKDLLPHQLKQQLVIKERTDGSIYSHIVIAIFLGNYIFENTIIKVQA